MNAVSACGSALTPDLVRLAMKGIPTPAKAIAHPAQVAAWQSCALMVGAIKFDAKKFDAKKFPDFGIATPLTMGRVPIEERMNTDMNAVWFVDEKDWAVAVISNLAIPTGF